MDDIRSDEIRTDREMLRHTVATLAYRAARTLRDVPDSFPSYLASPTSRTPSRILAHMCDLFDWALRMARGDQTFTESEPRTWSEDSERFFAALRAFDLQLASDAPLGCPAGKLFQGPVADALTHTGQLAMLRRIAGSPIRGENYFLAEIVTGRVGAAQGAPRHEFD